MEMILKKFSFLILSILVITSTALYANEKIVIFHPEGDAFQETIKSIRSTIAGEIDISLYKIKDGAKWSDMKDKIIAEGPKLFILLDNSAIKIYRDYVTEAKASDSEPIGAIGLMALQLEKESEGLDHLLGISYEIPVVTSVVNLRAISSNPIAKVGVIHRASWKPFIDQNAEFCKSENIQLVSFPIDDDQSKFYKDIKKGIKQLLKDDEVDALWIVSDNKLLNATTLQKAWLPGLKKSKIPSIAGVENLVTSPIKLGSFAVLPDHTGLGEQVANLLFDLMDNEWQIEERKIDQPLSVIKLLNTEIAKKKGFLKESGLSTIDKEVE